MASLPSHAPVAPPRSTRAVELSAYDGRLESLRVVDRPLPPLRDGEVLVRMAAAPINPSDLMFMKGLYGTKKELPAVPGLEGSGTVVAAGRGLRGRALVGRRVACASRPAGDGTWAEYLVTGAELAIPLRRHVSEEQGATLIVNPITAWALFDIATRSGAKAIAQTAAASALGKMLLALSLEAKLPMVHVVRRQGQAEELKQLGGRHLLDTSHPDSPLEMKSLLRHLGVTLALDAIAGDITGRLLRAMGRGGRVVVYGALSESPCAIDPGSLIFEGTSVEGFWLSNWLRRAPLPTVVRAAWEVQSRIDGPFHTEIRARYPLARIAEAVGAYQSRMSGGKVLLVPASR